jgi:uncharacterized membrane protein
MKNLSLTNLPRFLLSQTASLLILIIFFIFSSCTGSDETEEMPMSSDEVDEEIMPGSLSYSTDIRPIIQGNCVICHGNPPTNSAPMSLTTLNEVRDAINNRGLLSRINSNSNPMPPDGLLPMAARQAIADWADLGFPE